MVFFVFFLSYPPLPINRPVDHAELSRHTKDLYKKNKLSEKSSTRLVADVHDKERVRVHLTFLKTMMESGVEVENLYRAVYFQHSSWIKEFVLYNTMRRDQARDEFEKSFFKLIINSQVN